MRALLLAGLPFVLLAAAPADAQDSAALSVDQYIARWQASRALADKGDKAAEFVRLAQMFGDIFERYRETLEADEAAGRVPRACPKKGRSDGIELEELIAALAKLPAAERVGPLQDAVYGFFDRRYPCPIA